MNKLFIFIFSVFSILHIVGFAESYDQWVDPNDEIPGLQQVDYEVSYFTPQNNGEIIESPTRLRAREQWQKNRFGVDQFEESSWPGRREELSDELSR